MPNDSLSARLQHLIEVNQEAEAGFLTAVKNVRNSEMETMLSHYAGQHAEFAQQLRAELERLGDSPADAGSVGGALHRGWMNIKSTLTGHSVGSMLSACDYGEESAEGAYLDAVDAHPSGRSHTLLAKHIEQIKGFRARLRRLIDEVKDGLEFPDNDKLTGPL